jgi:hypothetical protein
MQGVGHFWREVPEIGAGGWNALYPKEALLASGLYQGKRLNLWHAPASQGIKGWSAPASPDTLD